MERTTKELILPSSQCKVVLYDTLVSGDFKKLQRKILENIKIDLNSEAADLPKELKDIPAVVAVDNQEFTLKLLIKEIFDKSGEKIVDIDSFLYNLPIQDSTFLDNNVAEISKSSQLSTEDKKK